MSKDKESSSMPNPWFLVSIVLGVVVVLLFIMNFYTISKVGTTTNVVGNTNTVPTQPSAPAAPSAPAPGAVVAVSADDDPSVGPKNAKVTIIEFSDFQCPFCARFHTDAFKQIKTDYIDTGKVRFVYRDYPLGFHPQAQKAAEASECADDQGKYWEMYEVLWANTASLSVDGYKKWASDLGLNTATFNDCLDSGKYEAEVKADFAAGQAAGVTGTPTFFINGQKLVGAQPFSAFKTVIDAELAK